MASPLKTGKPVSDTSAKIVTGSGFREAKSVPVTFSPPGTAPTSPANAKLSLMPPSGATSSHQLADLARAGDPDAFRRLFVKYQRRLSLFIHYRLGDALRPTLEVDDILQETFLEAARDLPRFTYRGPDSFFRWLASIARHAIEDAARRESRKKRDAGQRVPIEDLRLVDSLTPSRILFQSEQVRHLMARLDALPPQYREIIVLSRLEGLSPAELAQRLNKPRDAVALLLHRALQRLRQQLPS